MKRACSLLLTAAMLFSLAGCQRIENVVGGKAPGEKPRASAQTMYKQNGVSYAFRTGDRYLERYNGETGVFETFYVEGVNIGSGKPNYFPGEMGITKEEYLEWFRQIAEMNANSVRVYTVLGPAFYEAFYEHNTASEHKLYLFQGCWYDEDILENSADAFKTLDGVKKDLKDLVDIFHGKAEIKPRPGHASGTYSWDISNYVAGWILGIESEAYLVESTNYRNRDKTEYQGEYLCCKDVQPYEVFWCEIGDYVLSYEDKTYHTQRPVSFTNWPTADVMSHPNEPLTLEDAVSLNAELVVPTEKFLAGRFASYHIYPHYPNFMFLDEKYVGRVNEKGEPDPYLGYLEDMISHHSCPVLVAEFGVPASRGVAHINTVSGFNQGGNTGEEQGEMLVSMLEDIKHAGYAGGLVFSWQDEWFKKVWNTTAYNNAERRPFWNDMQTCEQHYGLLEFVSDEAWPTPVIDGQDRDWMSADLVAENGSGAQLYAKVDSTYVYLLVKAPGADFSKPGNLLYFNVTPGLGGRQYGETILGCTADYVLNIDGKDGTRLMVHRSADYYHVVNDIFDAEIVRELRASPDGFGPEYQIIDYEHTLPLTMEKVPVQRVETGRMRFGTSDEESAEYDPLADFCYDGDVLEIRIPWQMLGFRDPSSKEVHGYFIDTGKAGGVNVDGITVGLITPEGDQGSGFFTWKNWAEAITYPRLRASYYIVQDYLANETDRPGQEVGQ